jgi:serine phosphatase RsbU (regulator of sigma subunit)
MKLIHDRQSIWTLAAALLITSLLVLSYTFRIGDAAVAAIVEGLLMAVLTGKTGYVGLFGCTALLAAVFVPLGRILSVAAFLFGAMGVGILYEPQLLYELVPALLAGCVLFFLIPEKALLQLRDTAGTGRYASMIREEKRIQRQAHQLKMQIMEHSRRWQDLSEAFSLLPMERELFLQGAKTLEAYEGMRTSGWERPRINLISGVAKAVGGRDCISGDNYSTDPLDGNRLLVLLSDGMGSGRQAYHDSDQVVSRVEQLLETGFSLAMATELVHRWLLAQGREDVGTTLDAGVIDLVSGESALIKAGAAASYLLREQEQGIWQVELLNPESMPLGIFEELHTGICHVRLHPGDMLVMMTDGVLDGLSGEMKEERMRGFLEYEAAKLTDPSPGRQAQALAAAILEFARSDGETDTARDDMTIMTFVVTAV